MKALRKPAPGQCGTQVLVVRHVRRLVLQFPFIFMNGGEAYPFWLSGFPPRAELRQ